MAVRPPTAHRPPAKAAPPTARRPAAGPGSPAAPRSTAADAPPPAAMGRILGARTELRRQLREQRRLRTIALLVVVAVLLGAPVMYLGIQTATRDPALNSLAALAVPDWAAESPEDRIITGSRWCAIDCRFWERRLESQGNPVQTNEVYQRALRNAGWRPWEVAGCPQVDVDGFYTCWRRDEYTLDLWVHPPACAYDPLHLRRNLSGEGGPVDEDCTGSVVEIKMQHRVADERGLGGQQPEVPTPGSPGPPPGGTPTPPAEGTPTPAPSDP